MRAAGVGNAPAHGTFDDRRYSPPPAPRPGPWRSPRVPNRPRRRLGRPLGGRAPPRLRRRRGREGARRAAGARSLRDDLRGAPPDGGQGPPRGREAGPHLVLDARGHARAEGPRLQDRRGARGRADHARRDLRPLVDPRGRRRRRREAAEDRHRVPPAPPRGARPRRRVEGRPDHRRAQAHVREGAPPRREAHGGDAGDPEDRGRALRHRDEPRPPGAEVSSTS